MQHMLGAAPVRLLEITLDPQFDTPRRPAAYGVPTEHNRIAGRWPRGAPASIDELAARMGIATQWTRPGTLVHTEAAIVLDRQDASSRRSTATHGRRSSS